MRNDKIKNIIILHGWKLTGDKYITTKNILEGEGYRVFNPDLPGFGKNNSPEKEYFMDDYAEYLELYLEKNKIHNCLLVGHSFGGRVIIAFLYKYTSAISKFKIQGIVLTGAPLVSQRKTLRKRTGKIISIIGKNLFGAFPILNSHILFLRKILYRFIGEYDYYKSGSLKNTFINIIKYNLEDKLMNIKIPVLLIWGKDDKITPLEDAYKIVGLIKGSKLVIIDDATHKLPYEKPELFAKNIKSFIENI